MTLVRKFTTILCLLFVTACASTLLSGIVDPNYKDNFQAQKIVVMGSGMSIDELKTLEKTLEVSFSNYDIEVLYGLTVFPPTREYSNDDIYKISRDSGADTILIISADNRDVTKSYVPMIYHNFFITGGYTVSNRSINFSVVLKNAENSETIWKAEGISGGSNSLSFSDLTISLAKKTILELSKEGLIIKKDEHLTDGNVKKK